MNQKPPVLRIVTREEYENEARRLNTMQDKNTIEANAAAQAQLSTMQRTGRHRCGRKRIGNTRLARITLPDDLTTALDRWIERNGYPMPREKAVMQLLRKALPS